MPRRHKQDSKRRWIARYRLGRMIPMFAVVQHQLQIDLNTSIYDVLTEHVRLPMPS